MEVWDIVLRVLAIVGPLLAVWLGTNINKVIKELKEFIATLRAAYADGDVTKDEIIQIVNEALDVLVEVLPFFVGKKLKSTIGNIRWKEN